MLKLDGIAAFVATADAGSISEAARRNGLPKSVVSERLFELERALGARLLHRTTRKMSLTEDGIAFLVRARRMVDDANAAAAEIAERRGALVGPLRLSAPVSFGTLHLGPAIYGFLKEHPRIDLTLDLDDRLIDFAADGYDAVVRQGPVGDQRLIVKRLTASRRVLVAAPSYLEKHGLPSALHELEAHRAILYVNREAAWRFSDGSSSTVVRPRHCMRVNNGLIMRDAAVAGLGITLLPMFTIHRELLAGELVQIELDVEAEGAEIYLVYPTDRGASAKLQALTEWLRHAFGEPPYWEPKLQAAGAMV
jgi:DNA-binding transcriptional LysR family regulator